MMSLFSILALLVQTSLFYSVPLVMGLGWICLLLGKSSRMNRRQLPAAFALGVLSIFCWSMLCWYGFHQWFGIDFRISFFGGIWLGCIASLGGVIRKPLTFTEISKRDWGIVMGIVCLAAFSYFVWLRQSPYPLNWDWYQHQTLARHVQQGRFSFYTTEMSDTFGFNSYPPTFHLLLSIAQFPMSLTPDYVTDFWQVLSFWHVVGLGVVGLYVGWYVTRNRWVAFLSGALSVLTFDSMVSLSTFCLLPQTVAGALGTALLVEWIFNEGEKHSWWELGAIIILPLIHFMVGGVASLVVLGSWAVVWLEKHSFPATALVVLGICAGLLLASQLPLNTLNHGEAAHFTFSVQEKITMVERVYGYLGYLLIPLGFVYAFRETKRRQEVWLGVLFFIGFTAMAFSTVPYVLKLWTLGRFWIGLLMSLGVWELVRYIRSVVMRIAVLIAFCIGVSIILCVNVSGWKTGLLYEGIQTHISLDDMAAARMLQAQYATDSTVLVSDPATQFILEGLSGIESPGGAYMTDDIRKSFSAALLDASPAAAIGWIRQVSDKDVYGVKTHLLALSGRTFNWLTVTDANRWSYSYNTWAPLDLTNDDRQRIASFSTLPGVSVVFSSPYMSILKVE